MVKPQYPELSRLLWPTTARGELHEADTRIANPSVKQKNGIIADCLTVEPFSS